MTEEITESAKALQEVAKASQQGIAATEKMASFFAPYVKEPIESVFGILSDRLRFVRWKRQLRLLDKVQEIVKTRKLEEKLNTIPLKFAIPIIENASIEEDDDLQDLWASLLVASGDPEKNVKIGFISILKQLDPLDARILNDYYNYAQKHSSSNDNRISYSTRNCQYIYHSSSIPISYIPMHLKSISYDVDERIIKSSVDNLIRLRVIAEHVHEETLEIPDKDMDFSDYEVSIVSQDYFHITALGEEFIKACQH